MKTSREALRGTGRRSLDHELAIVSGAIGFVASGEAARVQCGGLRFGAQLLEPARSMGRAAAVRVTPIWGLDERIVALAIERMPRG